MIDATAIALEKAIGLRTQAHAIHTSNIANANVPDFKAKKIDFDDRMQSALESLDGKAPMIRREGAAIEDLKDIQADVYEDPLAKPSGDGNTVNMDREQTEIAKNMIGYEGAIQILNKKFALAKYSLSEGSR